MAQHPNRRPNRFFSALGKTTAIAAVASLVYLAMPHAAQSQISSKVISAPTFSSAISNSSDKPSLPKAPVQVELPPPPPMRIVPGLEEPLVATGPVTDEENKDLDVALKAFHDAPDQSKPGDDYDDYAKPLRAFIAAHPQSNWNAALHTDLGFGYYRAGYYSRVFTELEQAWQLGRDATSIQARLLIDRAVGELAKMHARVGHEKELEALFKDVGNRPIGGPATELFQAAHYGSWIFRNDPGTAYLCGPRALRNILIALKATQQQIKVADDARSGTHGFSLEQLATLATKARLSYTLIERKPGQPIPVPSIVNWNVHHYAAITRSENGLYHVEDPTFGDVGGPEMTAKAIDEQGSGYFLVPSKVAADMGKAGWRKVGLHSQEAKTVYGMGQTDGNDPSETMFCVSCAMQKMSDSTKIPDWGMTVANANSLVVSLNLSDTSNGYTPQVGLPALTHVVYNQREALQPANFGYFNVGQKWSTSWGAYIQDNPQSASGLPLTRIAPSGGGMPYSNNFTPTTGAYVAELWNQAITYRVPATGTITNYTRYLPDGGKEIYSLFDGAKTAPRRVFLTQAYDKAGNLTTYNYDGTLRLTSVVDAMGRSTTFTYGLASYPLMVTAITDPFGRATQFNYDTSLRLSSITDAAGVTSTYTYSTTQPTFITQLITPYGTSNFSDTVNSHDTAEPYTYSLTMKDPLGYSDYLYFYPNPNIVPPSDPAATVPTGMTISNMLLQWRNTFYWDKHAFALGVTTDGSGNVTSEDFTKAFLMHWTHYLYNTGEAGQTYESTRGALENRVWNNYANQAYSYYGGTYNQPIATGRVLDDGTSQVNYATYNPFGKPLTVTDPKGRITKYGYATNNIDLLTIQQLTTSPSTYTTIGTFGNYTSQHEPQTWTGADGQVWHYTYNTAGQIKTITDPNTGVTTYNYDTSGRLSTVQDANLVTVLTLTYDGDDRIQTRTDSEGYVLTYAYDNLDRITKITYPDATTDLYDYTFQSGTFAGTASLELRKHTDRLGRVTTYGYDADRRLTSVTEPLASGTTRTTTYAYYEDGTLKDIIDADSNDTHWDIDIQSRPIDKVYAYGTTSAKTETYAYETTTSRLHSITDALGQVKTFTYGPDDRVTGIAYSSTVNPTPNVSFSWDTYFPRLTSMVDGLGTTGYAYTAIGTNGALKLSSTDGPYSNDVIGLTYDALGRLSGRTVTGGNETFGYDAISRMNAHGTPLGSFTLGYLGQTNQLTSQSVTNGTVTASTSWGYDTNVNDRRLISILNSGVTRSYTLGYGTGPVNPYDIMSITDTAATGHPWATQGRAYSYDQSDRLLTASSTTPGNDTYAYDKLDNATTYNTPGTGSLSPTFNVLNQLATFGAKTYAYDADGNTLSGDGTKTYKWDAENRLIEIDYVGTSNKSVFSYDGLGHRTVDAETVSGTTTTTYYLWCGSHICQTRNSAQTATRRDLDEGEYNVSTGQKLIYMPDQLGSVRDVLDAATGTRVASYDFTPYGAVARSSVTNGTDYQYAGLFAHAASGLNFAKYRVQDGATGRWLNRDPIRELAGPNLYDYLKADPINDTDVLGTCGDGLCQSPDGTIVSYTNLAGGYIQIDGIGGSTGLQTGIGQVGTQAGMPTVDKPGGLAGGGASGPVTSPASRLLRGGPRFGPLARVTGTTSVGGSVARALPVIGPILMFIDYLNMQNELDNAPVCTPIA